MTHRPRITDESVLARWMGLEIARMNEGVVEGQRTLSSLLAEERPAARTRAGAEYLFDRGALSRLGDGLPDDLGKVLKIPILFYLAMDVPDSCYLDDATAVRALQALGELGEGRHLTDGRLWVSRAIAYAIARRYPTAVQFAVR